MSQNNNPFSLPAPREQYLYTTGRAAPTGTGSASDSPGYQVQVQATPTQRVQVPLPQHSILLGIPGPSSSRGMPSRNDISPSTTPFDWDPSDDEGHGNEKEDNLNASGNEESDKEGEISGEEKGGRVCLSTDQQKADLIKLCIQNFGRYVQGKKKFFEEIQKLYKDTYGTNLNVMGYMHCLSGKRKKEIKNG